MSNQFTKIAAIFSNQNDLKSALDELQQARFQHISVLVKSEIDLEDHHEAHPEVRTHSTATYPSTRPVMQAGDTFRSDGMNESPIDNQSMRSQEKDHQFKTDQLKDGLKHDDISVKDPSALIKGSIWGAVLGGLAGAGALLIPGVGPVLAVGPLAAAAAAIASGGAAGMAVGAVGGLLKDEGIPQDQVDVFREAFESGQAVMIVSADGDDPEGHLQHGCEILNRYHAISVHMF